MTDDAPVPGGPPRRDPEAPVESGTAPPPPSAPAEQPPPLPPVAALPSGNDPYQLQAARNLGWNWGGFLLPFLWLIGHGRLTLGLLLTLSGAIPLLNWLTLLAYPVAGIVLGLKGFEVAWRHQPYHSVEQLEEREREWAIWGFIGIVLLVVGASLFIAFLLPMYREMLGAMEGYGG